MKKISLFAGLIVTLIAATTATAEEKIPDCMSDVKAGEWVIYELPSRIQQKHSVKQVEEGVATIEMQMIMNGQVISTMEEKVVISDMKDKSAPYSPKIYKGEANVKDSKIDCTVIEATVEGKVSKTYMSNQIPVMGIIASEYNGVQAMTLIDYGFEPVEE